MKDLLRLGLSGLSSKKGLTLTELIVTIVVFSIILTSAAAFFVPMLRSYIRTVDFAEANTLIDTIATLVINEVTNSTHFEDNQGRIGAGISDLSSMYELPERDNWHIGNAQGTVFRIYDGTWQWSTTPENEASWRSVIDRNYYRSKNLFIGWYNYNGVVTLTIRLEQNNDWWQMERNYAVRVLGLVPN